MATPDDDAMSTFVYDNVDSNHTFNLTKLNAIVNAHFKRKCVMRKMDEGGYHKVTSLSMLKDYSMMGLVLHAQAYEAFESDDGQLGRSLDAVIRVASPAFPGDKMRSEVRA